MTKYLSNSCAKASYYMCIHTSSQRINSTLPGITEAQPLLAPCAILPHEFGSKSNTNTAEPSDLCLQHSYSVWERRRKHKNWRTDTEVATGQKLENTSCSELSLRKAARNRKGPNPEQHMWTSVTHSGARKRDLSFLICWVWKILTVGVLGKEYPKDKKIFCEF